MAKKGVTPESSAPKNRYEELFRKFFVEFPIEGTADYELCEQTIGLSLMRIALPLQLRTTPVRPICARLCLSSPRFLCFRWGRD